jgi:hypothetical protein
VLLIGEPGLGKSRLVYSRVEETMILFRLRHTVFQGFPVGGSLSVCHAGRWTPPSSNRTCGFPASGFHRTSRLRRAQAVARQPCAAVSAPVAGNASWC